MKRVQSIFVLGALVLLTGRSAFTQQDEEDEFEEADSVAVATLLFRDGFYDRAEVVLESVDLDAETVDLMQYWRLRGLVASRLSKYADAATYYQNAIRVGDREPQLYLLLAQAYGQSDQWEKAAFTLRLAPEPVKGMAESWLLESTAFVRIGKKYEAYRTLNVAAERFPSDRRLERQQLFLLIEMGLYQAAIEKARNFLAYEDIGTDDRVALAQALRKGGQIQRAILMLEEALLHEPNSQEARRELAAAYNQAGRDFTSAEVLRPVAWLDAEWARQAAELYKKANMLEQATLMNARVADQKAKVTQRLALLLKKEDYEAAAALDRRLVRLGLLEQEELVYALAYAHFRIGDYARAEVLLQRITDADLFRKAVVLRESIEQCVQDDWQCQ